MTYRIVFGVSGASGMPLAMEVLQAFAAVPDLAVHLVVSRDAELVQKEECPHDAGQFSRLATVTYDPSDMAAGPSSGSWRHDGMIVCPCSTRSLAAIASGCGTNLIHRAADVCLKERRPLVLVVRETPLGIIHINNMRTATEAGAIIMPFAPAFYVEPHTLPAMMRHFAGRMLDQLRIPHALCQRWRDDMS